VTVTGQPTTAPLIGGGTPSPAGTPLTAPFTTREAQTIDFSAAAVSQMADVFAPNYAPDFGDGSTRRGAAVSHADAHPAGYHFRLLVSDPGGTTEQALDVIVTAVPLSPVITGPAQTDEGSTYTLTLGSNPDAQPVTAWTINWGDGTVPQVVAGDQTSVTHLY